MGWVGSLSDQAEYRATLEAERKTNAQRNDEFAAEIVNLKRIADESSQSQRELEQVNWFVCDLTLVYVSPQFQGLQSREVSDLRRVIEQMKTENTSSSLKHRQEVLELNEKISVFFFAVILNLLILVLGDSSAKLACSSPESTAYRRVTKQSCPGLWGSLPSCDRLAISFCPADWSRKSTSAPVTRFDSQVEWVALKDARSFKESQICWHDSNASHR